MQGPSKTWVYDLYREKGKLTDQRARPDWQRHSNEKAEGGFLSHIGVAETNQNSTKLTLNVPLTLLADPGKVQYAVCSSHRLSKSELYSAAG